VRGDQHLVRGLGQPLFIGEQVVQFVGVPGQVVELFLRPVEERLHFALPHELVAALQNALNQFQNRPSAISAQAM
jgi:hypothetical protein